MTPPFSARWLFTGSLLLALLAAPAIAQDMAEEEIEILDNSFLIEEAYNQEPGVVQHIFNWIPSWSKDGPSREFSFDFVFTQEWPIFSQEHQFSYTLPMSYASESYEGDGGTQDQGFGDVLLNYRYQALFDEGWHPAFAPRFSVILPTGDEEAGLGAGEVGYQVNLPFSKQFERWALHFNSGLTSIPDASAGVNPELGFAGSTLQGYNLGGSVIRVVRPTFHAMLETLALWDEEHTFEGTEDDSFQLLLSPGFRWAAFTAGPQQWVVGMGVPVGLTADSPDVSLFLYMSFEHAVSRRAFEK